MIAMFSVIKKIYLMLGVLLFGISLSSCSRENIMIFSEGLYEYSGDLVIFYEDINLSKISFNFALTDKDAQETNVITNRANRKNYYVEFGMESNGNFELYDFTYLSDRANQAERYYIKFEVSNLLSIDNSYATFVLDFYDFKNISDMSSCIYVSFDELLIGDDLLISTGFDFASSLKLKLV